MQRPWGRESAIFEGEIRNSGMKPDAARESNGLLVFVVWQVVTADV
jgi:hypothetical protein